MKTLWRFAARIVRWETINFPILILVLILVAYVAVSVAFSPEPADTTPRNDAYKPRVTWEGYGVDWMLRSLRIGTSFKDSLMADGWLGLYGIDVDTLRAGTMSVDTLIVPGYVSTGYLAADSALITSWLVADSLESRAAGFDTLSAGNANADSLTVEDASVTGILYVDSIGAHSPVRFITPVIADRSVNSPQVGFSYTWPADTLLDKTAEASTGAGSWGSGHGMGFRIASPTVLETVTAFAYTGGTASDVYWTVWASFPATFGGGYAGEAPDGTFDYWQTGAISDTLEIPGSSDSLEMTWTFDPPVFLSTGVYFLQSLGSNDYAFDEAAHRPIAQEAWGNYTNMAPPTATTMDYRILAKCGSVSESYDLGFLIDTKMTSAVSLEDGYSFLRSNFLAAVNGFVENLRSYSGADISVRSPVNFFGQLSVNGRPGMSDTLVTVGNDTLFVNFGLVTGFVPGP